MARLRIFEIKVATEHAAAWIQPPHSYGAGHPRVRTRLLPMYPDRTPRRDHSSTTTPPRLPRKENLEILKTANGDGCRVFGDSGSRTLEGCPSEHAKALSPDRARKLHSWPVGKITL